MQQAFTDPKTGSLMRLRRKSNLLLLKARQMIRKYATFNEYVDNAMLQRLGEKYQSLISGAVYVPKWMSRKNEC